MTGYKGFADKGGINDLRLFRGCLKISDSPVGTTGNSPAIHCRVRKKRHVTDLHAMRPGNELPGYFQKSLWDLY